MWIKRHTITLGSTTSGGAATKYTDDPVNGRVLSVRYVPDGTSPLDTGAGITITGEVTSEPVLALTSIGTSAFTKLPRVPVCGPTGTVGIYGAGATVQEPPVISQERLKVSVTAGGDTKTGTLYINTES